MANNYTVDFTVKTYTVDFIVNKSMIDKLTVYLSISKSIQSVEKLVLSIKALSEATLSKQP